MNELEVLRELVAALRELNPGRVLEACEARLAQLEGVVEWQAKLTPPPPDPLTMSVAGQRRARILGARYNSGGTDAEG